MSEIKDELEAIKGEEPMLHAGDVVEWARERPSSALHGQFEWDDSKAAHEHRLEQARRLIRLHVVTEAGEPKLVSLTYDRARGGGYRDLSAVARSKDLSELLLRDALSELKRVRDKYKRVQALTKVWAAIDAAKTEHQPETRSIEELRA